MNAVLITGAAGFLGFHLCEYYLKKNYTVLGLDNFSTGSKANIDYLKQHHEGFLFLQKDVCEPWGDVVLEADKRQLDFKYVFHLASPASPEHYKRLALETIKVNTTGLQLALEFSEARKARLIFSSTSEVYGDPEVSPQPESYWGNVNSFGERSCYDEAKRCGEALIFSYNRRYGERHGLVRIFNTYGPRMNPDDGRVVINFIQQALSNSDISVYGDGSQTRSFCYVSDLVSGMVHYAESDLCLPLNLGMDQECSVLELAELVKKITHSSSVIKYFPLPVDDPRRRKPDLRKARENLPTWRPVVELEEGLRQMAAWLKAKA